MRLREFFIKRWYLVGIGWLLLAFLPVAVFQLPYTGWPVEIIWNLLLFPYYIVAWFFEGQVDLGYYGFFPIIFGYLAISYILAKLLQFKERKEAEK